MSYFYTTESNINNSISRPSQSNPSWQTATSTTSINYPSQSNSIGQTTPSTLNVSPPQNTLLLQERYINDLNQPLTSQQFNEAENSINSRKQNASLPPKRRRKESQVNYAENANNFNEPSTSAQISVVANNKNNASQPSTSAQCNSFEAMSKCYCYCTNRINN